MERINQFQFFQLGSALKQLRSYNSDNLLATTIVLDLWAAQRAIDALVVKGDPVPLGVSKTAATTVKRDLDNIEAENCFQIDDDGKRKLVWPTADKIIPAWQWNGLVRSLDTFETIFAAEMAEATAYFVPRRGIYYTPALVENAEETFPAYLAPFIPPKAKKDWHDAGRCLAFNLLSASGFHVARAVEGTVEAYYQMFCGKPANSTLRSWHDYVLALEEAAQSGAAVSPSPKVAAELRQMKDDYRNPIMHPRVVLTEADARMLFANGESLIIAMAQDMCETKKRSQPSLDLASDEEVPF